MATNTALPNVYVDADACPVKDEIVRVAARHGLQTYMVSNQGTRAAVGPNLHAILVGPQFDAADDWIVEHLAAGDIVVTSDIQLAARALELKAEALGPTGRPFTPDSIGGALAMRELSQYLREAGEIKGYNASFSKQDRSNFLQSLETVIQRLKRG